MLSAELNKIAAGWGIGPIGLMGLIGRILLPGGLIGRDFSLSVRNDRGLLRDG